MNKSESQLKVLRIVSSINPKGGGVSNAVIQTIGLLHKENIVIDLLCFDTDENEIYKTINLGKSYTHYKINLTYLMWLYRNAKKYDLVIIDGLWQFKSFGAYILKFLGIPYCVFVHGMLDPYFNKDLFKYLKKIPFWFCVERQMLSFASKVIFTCIEEERLARESFPLIKFESAIVTLGAETNSSLNSNNEFLILNPNLKEIKFALFLSRIHPKKGIDILLEAFSISEIRGAGYHLVIAGPGDEAFIKKLKIKAKKLEIEHLIHWVGMLNEFQKNGAYKASDFLILPSHQENFGIVIAEALSTATAVLISNKINIWEIIEKNNAGLVDNDSVSGVVCLFNRWLAMSELQRLNMSQKAEECFKNHFTNELASAELKNVLIEIKDRHNA